MEGQKRSRKAKWSPRRAGKQLTAFLLSAAMVLTNVGADVGTAYAADPASDVTFEVAGSELVRAVEEAVAEGNEIQPGDISFTNGRIDRFEQLLFGDGKLYEAYPEFDEDGSVDAYVRVFISLPEEADDMYMVTGDEEIIFLYVNNSDETIRCGTNITRMVDGEEKVKRTSRVTLRSYEAAYGDEEEAVIEQPVASPSDAPEASQLPEQTESQAPAAAETAGVEDGTQAPSEVTAGEEGKTAEAPNAEISGHETPVVQAREDQAQPAGETESVVRILTEEEAEDQAQETEAAEESAPAEETAPAQESTPAEETAPAQESAPAEETAPAQESAPAEETATVEESAPAEETATAQESAPVQETVPETGSVVEVGTPEETAGQTEETAEADELLPVQTQDSEQGADVPQTLPAEPETATPSQPEEKPEKPEDSGHENSVPKAGKNDMVGIDGCSTAKAVATTLNKVKAFEDVEGFAVSYRINIEGAARIVDGPRGVEEGNELVFGVKNQLGYQVEAVEANGQQLEAADVQDNGDGSQTAWYSVPEVMEEQEVAVTMEETAIHPAVTLEPIVMDDGMVITISAGEGVLPEGVTATAARVNQDVEQAVMDMENAKDAEKTVSSVMAYDINLWLDGQLLDSEIWGGSRRVSVTFSGEPMEAQSGEADAFEVVYVKTAQDSDKAAKELVAAQEAEVAPQDIVDVETVSRTVDVEEGQAVEEISFMAEHFSIYAVIGHEWYMRGYTINVGEKVKLRNYGKLNLSEQNANWTIEDREIAQIIGKSRNTSKIEVQGLSAGTTTITANYSIGFTSFSNTFKLTVKPQATNSVTAEYWITNRPVTAGGATSKAITPELLSKYGENGVAVEELAPRNGTGADGGQMIYWQARVLPPGKHQTGNNGVDRLNDGTRIQRLRYDSITKAIQYYAFEKWTSIKADDQLVFYYLQSTDLAKQVNIAVSDWWSEDSKNYPREIEYKVIVEETGEVLGSKSTYYHKDHDGLSGIWITQTTEEIYSISKVTLDDQEVENFENGFEIPLNSNQGHRVVKIYLTVQKATLYLDYVDENGQYLVGGEKTSRIKLAAKNGSSFNNGYVDQDGKLLRTDYTEAYGGTGHIETDLTNMSKFESVASDYKFTGKARVDSNGTVLKLYYQKIGKYTVTYVPGKHGFFKEQRYEKLTEGQGTPEFQGNITGQPGYKFTGWYPQVESTVTSDKIYTAQWEKDESQTKSLSYTVEYYKDGEAVPGDTKIVWQDVWAGGPDQLTVNKEEISPADKYPGYALDYTDPQPIPESIDDGKTIKVYYAESKDGDNIPDKYQVTVTYRVVNGSWNDGTNAEKQERVTLMSDGTWSENGTATLSEIPEVGNKPAAGYQTGSWDEDPANAVIDKTGKREFIYTYAEDYDQTRELQYTVEYYKDGVKTETDTVTETVWVNVPDTELAVKKDRINTKDKYPGYICTETAPSPIPDKISNQGVIKVYYDKDENGDGVADKYQVTIVFTAVNGNFKDVEETDMLHKVSDTQIEMIVTLRDLTGNLSENGLYFLTRGQLPEADPAAGYAGEGIWDRLFWPQVISRHSENRVFTIYFYEKTEVGVTINYFYNNTPGDSETKKARYGDWFVVREQVEAKRDWEGKNYILEHADPESLTVGLEGNVVNVYYSLDENQDTVPDQYQAKVTYSAVNGTIDGAHAGQTFYVTVYKNGNPSEGYAEPGEAGAYGTLREDQIAEATPDEGYDPSTELWHAFGKETVKPADGTRITQDTHYTVTFGEGVYNYLIVKNYLDGEDGNLVGQVFTPGAGVFNEGIVEQYQAQTGDKFLQNDEYDGRNYILIHAEGYDKLVSANEKENRVEYTYVLDVNGDNIPDQYQAEVTYSAVNGTIDGAHAGQTFYVTVYKNGNPSEGYAEPGETGAYGNLTEEQLATATAAEGYDPSTELWHVLGRETVKPTTETRIIGDSHFEVTFGKAAYAYKVVKHYRDAEGAETAASTTEGTALFGENILEASKVTVLQNEEYGGKNYTLAEASGYDKLIQADAAENQVHLYYNLDENGDKVPDQYQIVFHYINKDGFGNVTGTVDEVHTFTNESGDYTDRIAVSPKAEIEIAAKDGYAFDYWTAEGTDEKDYRAGMDHFKAQKYTEDTTFVVSFAEDKIGPADPADPDNPNKPDNVPDKYQVVFTYVSSDTTQGTVEGTVTEVQTRKKNPDGTYDMTEKFTPDAKVTASGIGRYYFDHWQAEDGSIYNNVAEIHTHSFDGGMTFTAYFEYRGNSGGGSSGGGGGGGNPSGNGRYQPETGGPGAETVTIGPDEVPLASLPDGMGTGTVAIDSNAVPLAPLPKTGQSVPKMSLAAMLSGIVLALTALGRKRREDKKA